MKKFIKSTLPWHLTKLEGNVYILDKAGHVIARIDSTLSEDHLRALAWFIVHTTGWHYGLLEVLSNLIKRAYLPTFKNKDVRDNFMKALRAANIAFRRAK